MKRQFFQTLVVWFVPLLIYCNDLGQRLSGTWTLSSDLAAIELEIEDFSGDIVGIIRFFDDLNQETYCSYLYNGWLDGSKLSYEYYSYFAYLYTISTQGVFDKSSWYLTEELSIEEDQKDITISGLIYDNYSASPYETGNPEAYHLLKSTAKISSETRKICQFLPLPLKFTNTSAIPNGSRIDLISLSNYDDISAASLFRKMSDILPDVPAAESEAYIIERLPEDPLNFYDPNNFLSFDSLIPFYLFLIRTMDETGQTTGIFVDRVIIYLQERYFESNGAAILQAISNPNIEGSLGYGFYLMNWTENQVNTVILNNKNTFERFVAQDESDGVGTYIQAIREKFKSILEAK